MKEYFKEKSEENFEEKIASNSSFIKKQHFSVNYNLDAVSFFHQMIQESVRLSLISYDQLEKIQHQLLDLITSQFHRFTSGQSSSVSVEIGQQIQQSLFYAMGYYLKNQPDAEAGFDRLKENPLSDLFSKGKKLIEAHWNEAKNTLKEIQENGMSTDVIAYNDTIHNGIPLFFQSYDMEYAAHETPGSIDYPLSNDNTNLTGIEYILNYLYKLQLENEFCSNFSAEEIHHLLRGYHPNYEELLFNLYDLVITNAVGSLFLDRPAISLYITKYDSQYLQYVFSSYPEDKIGELSQNAAASLCSALSISDPSMKHYIESSILRLQPRLKHALETDGLKYLFLEGKDDFLHQEIQYKDLRRLNDDSFRILADEIRECRLLSDKLTLLEREPLGMEDLIDLLKGYCFYEDEYLSVFQTLENTRLALLAKQLSMDPAGSEFELEPDAPEWQHYLIGFLNRLPPERKNALLTLAERMKVLI